MKTTVQNILVISDPPAKPGYLPRVRYLCDYLVRKGHSVTLLTEQYQTLEFEHTYPVVTIPMYNGRTADWMCKAIWTLVTDWHNRSFARRSLHQSAVIHPSWDLVICTTFNDFPLGAARRIARQLNVPLICDIRDLDEQVDDSHYQYRHQAWWVRPFRRLYRAFHIRRRNAVLRTADAITTVSPWHAEFIRTITGNRIPVSVLYNGYDDKQFYPHDIPTERFSVVYIGSLFNWQKPALEKVRQAVDELNKSKISDCKSQIFLDIHTPQHDPIAHDRLGETIRRSSVMLVLTGEQTHGMLTTKFYEALGCEKPVLCVPSDKGSLAELIQHTNAGIATDDPERIKAFLIEKQHEWQQRRFTRQATQHREQFSREAQYDQFYRTSL